MAGSAGALHVILPQLQRLTWPTAGTLFLVYHRQSNPDFHLADLAPGCGMAIREAVAGSRVESNAVHYPRDAEDLQVADGRLVVTPPGQRHHPNIDLLLASLAKAYGPRVLAVLLSGMATDGLQGLRDVRAAGGRTVVQSPESSRFPDLPAAAIEAGLADEVAGVEGVHAMVEAALASAAKGPGRAGRIPPRRQGG